MGGCGMRQETAHWSYDFKFDFDTEGNGNKSLF